MKTALSFALAAILILFVAMRIAPKTPISLAAPVPTAPTHAVTTADATEADILAHPSIHHLAMMATTVDTLRWRKDGFGSVMIADFAIKNASDVALKDVEIECLNYAPSGTTIDANYKTIYQLIPAHKTRTIREFNMGFLNPQTSESACIVVGLTVVEEAAK
jgi:hypothetical protein